MIVVFRIIAALVLHMSCSRLSFILGWAEIEFG